MWCKTLKYARPKDALMTSIVLSMCADKSDPKRDLEEKNEYAHTYKTCMDLLKNLKNY